MLRRLVGSFALSTVLAIAACSSPVEGDSEPSEANLTSSSVTTAIESALMARNPNEKNKTWMVTSGNLDGDWLMQVPNGSTWGKPSVPGPRACSGGACVPDFGLASCSSDGDCGEGACIELAATKKSDADPAQKVCVGHSDRILDEIYGVIASAHSRVDITTLTAPTGRFLSAIRNGITTLDKRRETVTVRVLLGSFPDNEPDLDKVLREITRDIAAAPGTNLNVKVGAHRQSTATWNHSKIIVADGNDAIVGGMNLWADHYLDANPVHDVSLHVRGPVATAAQIFANELWAQPCFDQKIAGNRGMACPRPFVPGAPAAGNVRMVGVGRLGIHSEGDRNPSDAALVAMMDAARSSIRISQQDIGSVKILFNASLPKAYMDAWIRAALRGVSVDIVVSNLDSFGGPRADKVSSYFNGWTLRSLWDGLLARARDVAPGHEAELCQRIHFSTIRASSAATWPNGRQLANHAKVVIVDEQAYYVGSQNLYDADLAEYGVIVDDATATRRFVADYYSKLAEFSRTTTFRDPSVCR